MGVCEFYQSGEDNNAKEVFRRAHRRHQGAPMDTGTGRLMSIDGTSEQDIGCGGKGCRKNTIATLRTLSVSGAGPKNRACSVERGR